MATFHHETLVEAPADEVFSWHERPGALRRLLPPWEPIRLLPAERHVGGPLTPGNQVRFKPPLLGPYTARQTHYDPPHEFGDAMVDGPFRRWEHRHRFEPTPTGTLVIDDIDYELPLGSLGGVGKRLVAAHLRRMFAYRQRQLIEDLAAHATPAARRAGRLRIAITGASGLIGTQLSAFLSTGGHQVLHLVRRQPRAANEAFWDPARGALDPATLVGVDAVINLAGAPIGGRLSTSRRREAHASRVMGTELLARTLALLGPHEGPGILINSSAIGYYGPANGAHSEPAGSTGDAVLTEDSPVGTGILAEIVRDWEDATRTAHEAGIRVARLRVGLVQSPAGGALGAQLPLFLIGAGGRLGHGQQWQSWVGIDDVIGMFHHALITPTIAGAMNVVAPTPVRNREYTRTLARVLRRPAFLPAPRWGLEVAIGESATAEMLLASQRVAPDVATATGYAFRHPELEGALRHVLGRLSPTSSP